MRSKSHGGGRARTNSYVSIPTGGTAEGSSKRESWRKRSGTMDFSFGGALGLTRRNTEQSWVSESSADGGGGGGGCSVTSPSKGDAGGGGSGGGGGGFLSKSTKAISAPRSPYRSRSATITPSTSTDDFTKTDQSAGCGGGGGGSSERLAYGHLHYGPRADSAAGSGAGGASGSCSASASACSVGGRDQGMAAAARQALAVAHADLLGLAVVRAHVHAHSASPGPVPATPPSLLAALEDVALLVRLHVTRINTLGNCPVGDVLLPIEDMWHIPPPPTKARSTTSTAPTSMPKRLSGAKAARAGVRSSFTKDGVEEEQYEVQSIPGARLSHGRDSDAADAGAAARSHAAKQVISTKLTF